MWLVQNITASCPRHPQIIKATAVFSSSRTFRSACPGRKEGSAAVVCWRSEMPLGTFTHGSDVRAVWVLSCVSMLFVLHKCVSTWRLYSSLTFSRREWRLTKAEWVMTDAQLSGAELSYEQKAQSELAPLLTLLHVCGRWFPALSLSPHVHIDQNSQQEALRLTISLSGRHVGSLNQVFRWLKGWDVHLEGFHKTGTCLPPLKSFCFVPATILFCN